MQPMIIRLWLTHNSDDRENKLIGDILLANIGIIKEILIKFDVMESDLMVSMPRYYEYDPRDRGYKWELFANLPNLDGIPIDSSNITLEIEDAIGLPGAMCRPFKESSSPCKRIHLSDNQLYLAHSTE